MKAFFLETKICDKFPATRFSFQFSEFAKAFFICIDCILYLNIAFLKAIDSFIDHKPDKVQLIPSGRH